MPVHTKVQVALFTETGLPRDAIVNVPCYRHDNLSLNDTTALCNDVLDAWDKLNAGNLPWHIEAKAYDLEGTPPVLPTAHVVRNQGVYADVDLPREVALCLSFSGGQHQPRQRGRLYAPVHFLRPLNRRPVPVVRSNLIEWGKALYDAGGPNGDWIVWSRRNKSATGVTRCWVNDEYDTQRRRGLRETMRDVHNF